MSIRSSVPDETGCQYHLTRVLSTSRLSVLPTTLKCNHPSDCIIPLHSWLIEWVLWSDSSRSRRVERRNAQKFSEHAVTSGTSMTFLETPEHASDWTLRFPSWVFLCTVLVQTHWYSNTSTCTQHFRWPTNCGREKRRTRREPSRSGIWGK